MVARGDVVVGDAGTLGAVANDQIVRTRQLKPTLAARRMVTVDAAPRSSDQDAHENVTAAVIITHIATGTDQDPVTGVAPRDAPDDLSSIRRVREDHNIRESDAIRAVAERGAILNGGAQAAGDAGAAVVKRRAATDGGVLTQTESGPAVA